jgi:hypothetical protein
VPNGEIPPTISAQGNVRRNRETSDSRRGRLMSIEDYAYCEHACDLEEDKRVTIRSFVRVTKRHC